MKKVFEKFAGKQAINLIKHAGKEVASNGSGINNLKSALISGTNSAADFVSNTTSNATSNTDSKLESIVSHPADPEKLNNFINNMSHAEFVKQILKELCIIINNNLNDNVVKNNFKKILNDYFNINQKNLINRFYGPEPPNFVSNNQIGGTPESLVVMKFIKNVKQNLNNNKNNIFTEKLKRFVLAVFNRVNIEPDYINRIVNECLKSLKDEYLLREETHNKRILLQLSLYADLIEDSADELKQTKTDKLIITKINKLAFIPLRNSFMGSLKSNRQQIDHILEDVVPSYKTKLGKDLEDYCYKIKDFYEKNFIFDDMSLSGNIGTPNAGISVFENGSVDSTPSADYANNFIETVLKEILKNINNEIYDDLIISTYKDCLCNFFDKKKYKITTRFFSHNSQTGGGNVEDALLKGFIEEVNKIIDNPKDTNNNFATDFKDLLHSIFTHSFIILDENYPDMIVDELLKPLKEEYLRKQQNHIKDVFEQIEIYINLFKIVNNEKLKYKIIKQLSLLAFIPLHNSIDVLSLNKNKESIDELLKDLPDYKTRLGKDIEKYYNKKKQELSNQRGGKTYRRPRNSRKTVRRKTCKK